MADDCIVSRATIAKRGVDAFFAGRHRDSHGMHPWTDAAKTFEQAWDAIANSKLTLQNTEVTAKRSAPSL